MKDRINIDYPYRDTKSLIIFIVAVVSMWLVSSCSKPDVMEEPIHVQEQKGSEKDYQGLWIYNGYNSNAEWATFKLRRINTIESHVQRLRGYITHTKLMEGNYTLYDMKVKQNGDEVDFEAYTIKDGVRKPVASTHVFTIKDGSSYQIYIRTINQ